MSVRLVAVAAIVSAALIAGLAVRGGDAGPPPDTSPKSTFSLAAARAFKAFPIYNAGESIDGLPLTAVLRRADQTSVAFELSAGDRGRKTGRDERERRLAGIVRPDHTDDPGVDGWTS